jgi:hypothetical protein
MGMDENPYKAPDQRGTAAARRRAYRKRLTIGQRLVVFSIASLQALICVVLALGDFTLQHQDPSRFSLDIDHEIFLVLFQAVLALSWIALAILFEKRSLLLVPLFVVAATFAAALHDEVGFPFRNTPSAAPPDDEVPLPKTSAPH